LSQRLLNEVVTAKLRLLNLAKKAAYDARLREQLAQDEPVREEHAASSINLGFDVSA
jgi:hypothetical protein